MTETIYETTYEGNQNKTRGCKEMKKVDFVTLYKAMCAFDNAPASCKALSAACAKVNCDYGKLRTDLLAFDCHGDRKRFLEKVNRKFRSICKAFNVEVEM